MKKELGMMMALAASCVLIWMAYQEKDAHTAAMLGYFAGLWGHFVVRVGGEP
jgi:hypothetical protein